jgi:hypothetical protein
MNECPSAGKGTQGFNLLNIRPVRAFVVWRGFPAVFQVLVLALFVALAVIGWGYHTPPGINAKLYAKTNIVNLLIWGLWWPAIVWVTFWLGRAWCIVCPLELVSSQAETVGRKLGLQQKPLGGWLAQGSLVIMFFAFLQLLVPGVQIHRVPHYTSLFLWISLAMAFAVGLFLRDRAFCRGFCPVALLLSAYGRGGILAVRSADCSASHTRACLSLLNPIRLNTSKDCLICGDCIKADTTGTMQLLLRAPYPRADAHEPVASWPLTLFVMIVSGFVTYELCGVWKAADPVFAWVPEQVIQALKAGAIAGWIKGLWIVLIVPLLIWLVLGVMALALGAGQSLGDAWRRLALPLAVVVAAGHMAKALEKFSSWAGFLPYALAEPSGVQTATKMNAKLLPQPSALLSPVALAVICLALLTVAIGLALREACLADPEKGRARFIPVLLLGSFYFFLVFGWGGWLK